jgi:hypothetical protein
MDFLIFARTDDETAIRVYSRVREIIDSASVRFISDDELSHALHWSHRVNSGGAETDILLASGQEICSSAIGLVFNRLIYPNLEYFSGSSEQTKEYAHQEMYALWFSWLESFPCPVVNPPTVRGLSCQSRSLAEWLSLAGQAGLPTDTYRFTSSSRFYNPGDGFPHVPGSGYGVHTPWDLVRIPHPEIGIGPRIYVNRTVPAIKSALIVGEHVMDPFEGLFHEGYQRLQKLIGCDIFEVIFSHADGENQSPDVREDGWFVTGVNTYPFCRDDASISLIAGYLADRWRCCS